MGSGYRCYAEEDLERVSFLSRLRATGMPIRQVRRYAELLNGGGETNEERLALLEEHRASVLALLDQTAQNLELIEFKIDLIWKGLARNEEAQPRSS